MVAAVVRTVRPDLLFVNEVDRDPDLRAVELLRRGYLEADWPGGPEPVRFPHAFAGEVNTGVPSGLDLDRDGSVGGPGDAFGFGEHPGQYGMVLWSRWPILHDRVGTFRLLRWAAMPAALLPADWHGGAIAAELRLSSTSHWDVPVLLPDVQVLHVLASRPTPPVFDGPEDRNGRRNHDEIRYWADYLGPECSAWIVDDQGRRGGLPERESFVIVGT